MKYRYEEEDDYSFDSKEIKQEKIVSKKKNKSLGGRKISVDPTQVTYSDDSQLSVPTVDLYEKMGPDARMYINDQLPDHFDWLLEEKDFDEWAFQNKGMPIDQYLNQLGLPMPSYQERAIKLCQKFIYFDKEL